MKLPFRFISAQLAKTSRPAIFMHLQLGHELVWSLHLKIRTCIRAYMTCTSVHKAVETCVVLARYRSGEWGSYYNMSVWIVEAGGI